MIKSPEQLICLITGSTDGIGKQTAMDLAYKGLKVIIHGRNEEKSSTVTKEIIEKTGNRDVEYVVADLASFSEIRKMSENIHDRFEELDILINNAGVYKNQKEFSQDGFELTFAVNHLSYYLITGLLLDLVRNSKYARIINVASQAHASQLEFDNFQGEKYYEGYDAYSRSKLFNILFTYKLGSSLNSEHITANVLHPGVISTKLLHEGWGSGGSQLSLGSKTSVYLAISEDVKNESGKYFSNSRISRSSKISYDQSVQADLWEKSEEMTGFFYNFSWE